MATQIIEYTPGEHKVENWVINPNIHSLQVDSDLKVGIFDSAKNDYVIRPLAFADWNDPSDTPYGSLALLITDLNTFFFDIASGGNTITPLLIPHTSILTLNTVRIPIVAAPGANKIVVPVSYTHFINAGTAYAGDDDLALVYEGSTTPLLRNSTSGLFGTIDAECSNGISNNVIAGDYINKALEMFIDSSNPTGGDAGRELKISLETRVEDFSLIT